MNLAPGLLAVLFWIQKVGVACRHGKKCSKQKPVHAAAAGKQYGYEGVHMLVLSEWSSSMPWFSTVWRPVCGTKLAGVRWMPLWTSLNPSWRPHNMQNKWSDTRALSKHLAVAQLDACLTKVGLVDIGYQELEVLQDEASVYKLIGPMLIKQDLVEAKANVSKRLEYIGAEMYDSLRTTSLFLFFLITKNPFSWFWTKETTQTVLPENNIHVIHKLHEPSTLLPWSIAGTTKREIVESASQSFTHVSSFIYDWQYLSPLQTSGSERIPPSRAYKTETERNKMR